MMAFVFNTTQDSQVAELSESGKLWLKELAPIAGVDFTAREQQLVAYAGMGDLIRSVRAEAAEGRSGGYPAVTPQLPIVDEPSQRHRDEGKGSTRQYRANQSP